MSDRGAFSMREEIASLRPYEPGMSAEQLQRDRGLDRVVKLGSNEGPWGPLPAAAEAIAARVAGLNRYPDGAFFDLRHALADHAGVDVSQVVLGNGADAILVNLALAHLEPGDEVVFGWPSFITYRLSVAKAGATPVMVSLDGGYRYDLDALLERIGPRTRFVYVCNPNNPTGTYVTRSELERFVEQLPPHVLCVVDEAYHEYVVADDYPRATRDLVLAGAPNVMVVRTFSKIFGLAGVRAGWAVAPPDVVRAIDTVRGPFEMNALADAGARASMEELHLLDERVQANIAGRESLEEALRRGGLEPIPSVGNFTCVPMPGGRPGRELSELLLARGVIVRPLDMFGMPDGVRITVGTPEETAFAVEALLDELPNLAG